jgi:thiol-disulfide isomerase/thioredoxin
VPAETTTVDDGTEAGNTTAQLGTYVDYRDGIIADTAGTKVLFFHAPWCPQCRAVEESILAGPIPDDLTIIKVDYDTATALRQQYGVTIQTTVVYVGDDGARLASEVLYSDTTLDALVAAAP